MADKTIVRTFASEATLKPPSKGQRIEIERTPLILVSAIPPLAACTRERPLACAIRTLGKSESRAYGFPLGQPRQLEIPNVDRANFGRFPHSEDAADTNADIFKA
mgnify:CR=1 FL=1